MATLFLRFLDYTQRRITVGKTPLDKGSARRRDLCLTTHKNHNKKVHVPRGIRTYYLSRRDPTDLQTYALDRAAAGTSLKYLPNKNMLKFSEGFVNI
jgi:hypothetical protein